MRQTRMSPPMLVLKADIFRNENNIIDLYVMLLRFSSLISETIPCYRDYKSTEESKKNALKKQLLEALKELEELKPAVKQKIDELDGKSPVEGISQGSHLGCSNSFVSSAELLANAKEPLTINLLVKTQQQRHERDGSSKLIPAQRDDESEQPSAKEGTMILFENVDVPRSTIVKQSSSPPVHAEMQGLVPVMPTSDTELQDVADTSLPVALLPAEFPVELHMSTSLMDTFMRVAESSTLKDLETSGVLAGSLKNRKLYVTALINSKQESTSDSVSQILSLATRDAGCETSKSQQQPYEGDESLILIPAEMDENEQPPA